VPPAAVAAEVAAVEVAAAEAAVAQEASAALPAAAVVPKHLRTSLLLDQLEEAPFVTEAVAAAESAVLVTAAAAEASVVADAVEPLTHAQLAAFVGPATLLLLASSSFPALLQPSALVASSKSDLSPSAD